MRNFDERNVDKLLANVVELHLLKGANFERFKFGDFTLIRQIRQSFRSSNFTVGTFSAVILHETFVLSLYECGHV